jgi:peroxiredoxin
LRQDYDQFVRRDAEILVLGPDGPNAFRRYWAENDMPFPGMADVGSKVADQYHQEVSMLKLGRMPAVFVIDQEGVIRYSHYAFLMHDYPRNEELFEILDTIKEEQAA